MFAVCAILETTDFHPRRLLSSSAVIRNSIIATSPDCAAMSMQGCDCASLSTSPVVCAAPQTVEPFSEFELLSELERPAHVREPHRFKEELLSCAGKEFTVGGNCAAWSRGW